jgi:hypothetical protein
LNAFSVQLARSGAPALFFLPSSLRFARFFTDLSIRLFALTTMFESSKTIHVFSELEWTDFPSVRAAS